MTDLQAQKNHTTSTDGASHKNSRSFFDTFTKFHITPNTILLLACVLYITLIILFPIYSLVFMYVLAVILVVYITHLMSTFPIGDSGLWRSIAKEKNWLYAERYVPKGFSPLLFNIGHAQRMHQVLQGEYNSFPIQTFIYRYATGFGKYKRWHTNTVYVYRIGETLPHCYLNYRQNKHYTPPPSAKKLPLTEPFASKFELYVTPEYEIEALSLFTPDVQQHLLDISWDYDLECIDKEIVIIQDEGVLKTITTPAGFDARLSELTGTVRYLEESARVASFTPIRETPQLFVDVKSKLPFWSIERYGTDRIFRMLGIVLVIFVIAQLFFWPILFRLLATP